MKVNTVKGCAVISVSAGTGCYRHIKIPMNKKLTYLADFILDCFDFDHDHLYSFFMNNRLWDETEEYIFMPEDTYSYDASEYKLSDLGLSAGKQFKFLYDYGDEWTFQCKVLRIENSDEKNASVIRSVGEAPSQYGMYDDEDYYDDEYDDDEEDDDDWFDFPDDEEDDDEDDDGFMAQLKAKGIKMTEKRSDSYSLISDELIRAAVEFRKSAGSRKSYFTQPFALKLSNGETGYVVYDTEAVVPTVLFYIGENGWKMYSRYWQAGESVPDEMDFDENSDVLCCNYVGSSDIKDTDYNHIKERLGRMGYTVRKYPFFTYRKALHAPWLFESEEQSVLFTEAMNALKYVFSSYRSFSTLLSNGMMYGRLLYIIPGKDGYTADEIQIPPHVSYDDYPSPSVKLKKLPLQGEWVCDICAAPDWVHSTLDSVPHVFRALVMIRTDRETPYRNSTFDELHTYEKIIEYMAGEFERLGYYPKTITVRNERTERLISAFCRSAGTRLERADEIPVIDEALAESGNTVSDDTVNNIKVSGEEFRKHMLKENPDFEFALGMMELMILEASPSEIRAIIKENPEQFRSLYECGIFSPEVQKKLKKYF